MTEEDIDHIEFRKLIPKSAMRACHAQNIAHAVRRGFQWFWRRLDFRAEDCLLTFIAKLSSNIRFHDVVRSAVWAMQNCYVGSTLRGGMLPSPVLDSSCEHAIAPLLSHQHHIKHRVAQWSRPFPMCGEKNSSALNATSKRLSPIVVLQYSPPFQWKLTQHIRCVRLFSRSRSGMRYHLWGP